MNVDATWKLRLIALYNSFDVDGDLIDFAYEAKDVIGKLLEELAQEESIL